MRALLCFLFVCAVSMASAANDFVLKGVTLVHANPNLKRQADSYIAVQDGRLKAIGTGHPGEEYATWAVVDGAGKYVVPGLIDSHVHLSSRPGIPYQRSDEFEALMQSYYDQSLRSYLYFGYTTVIDLNANSEHLATLKTMEPRPEIFDCSAGAPVANGYPMVFQPPEVRFRVRPNFIFNESQRNELPDYVEQERHTAAAVVQRVKESGAVCFKTFYETGFRPGLNWPVPDAQLMRQIRRHTRTAGLPLLIHANRESAQQAMLGFDIDVLVHGMWHWNPVNGQRAFEPSESAFRLIEALAAQGIKYMPTLQVLAGEAALFDPTFPYQADLKSVYPPSLLAWYQTEAANWYRNQLLADDAPTAEKLAAMHAENLDRLRQSAQLARHFEENDGMLLFGSDTPSDQTYGNPPGLNGYWEMQRWADAGISLATILKAATWNNAVAFNLSDQLGSIEVGKRADLVILDDDPLQTIQAYDTIRWVVRDGKLYERGTLRADRPQP